MTHDDNDMFDKLQQITYLQALNNRDENDKSAGLMSLSDEQKREQLQRNRGRIEESK